MQSPPSKSRLTPPALFFPQTGPVAPATSSSWATAQHPSHHQSNYNYNCAWSRTPMFPTPGEQDQTLDNVTSIITEWERRTPNSLTPHQSIPDENSAPQLPTNSEYTMSWHNHSSADSMVTDNCDFDSLPRKNFAEDHAHSEYDDGGGDDDESDEELEELEDVKEDQHEPCITMACRLLSSLSQFVRCDCENGYTRNNGSVSNSGDQRKPLTPGEEAPPSHSIFRLTQSATDNVSRLLNCTGIACTQDASTLLVLGAVLFKILTWYRALYQSEIDRQLSSVSLRAQPGANPTRPPVKSNHSTSSRSSNRLDLPRQVGGTVDSLYAVPLTIPLSIGNFDLPHATERKMKAQLLLCQLQSLHQVCQNLDRRVQGAEHMRGEKKACEGSSAQLLEQVAELRRILTVVCTQAPTE
ncbi:Ribosomal protein L10e/L16 [Penicillium waksmanii]|uniref:Ribosomal protein L10e/L16 n=1 Tax=Penicillium waksmanii TaxID=69791 RepID=UPI002547FAA0|nr:Ribosomal protein L10e/L16 [Penicillium waksmanii]KAJ5980187.1 Ribosomal protein L10e/L16 [Penicillium waksmanii]